MTEAPEKELSRDGDDDDDDGCSLSLFELGTVKVYEKREREECH